MTKWIDKINETEKDPEKLSTALLDVGRDHIREALQHVEHAGHVELTEFMAAMVAMLASASQRKRDPKLKRMVVKRIRSLCELLFLDNNYRETDPGDLARAVSACERILFHAGLFNLRVRLSECKSEKIHEENAEEFEASRQEQERVRAEMAEQAPMDGVDADLAAEGDDESGAE